MRDAARHLLAALWRLLTEHPAERFPNLTDEGDDR